MISRGVWIAALLGLPGSASPLSGGAGAAHPGPPIWLEALVAEAELVVTVHAEPQALVAFLGIERSVSELDPYGPAPEDRLFIGPHAPEEEARLHDRLAAAFVDHPRLRIDGRSVALATHAVRLPQDTADEDGWLVCEVELRVDFPEAELPKAITFGWERYEGTEWGGEAFVPVTIRHGRLPEVFALHPAEPELVWHAPRMTLEERKVTAVPADVIEPDPVVVPMGALGALCAAGLAVVVARRRGLSPAREGLVVWSCVALGVCGAFVLRDRAMVSLGSGSSRPARPDLATAATIFEELHAGIYRAFEATSEGEIYDALAACVGPELVAPLYDEVFESLVLRLDGGAVCAVERVDLRRHDVTLSDEEAFAVDAEWDVHGLVTHFGHAHRRRNAYHARYEIDLFPQQAEEGTLGGADGAPQVSRPAHDVSWAWKVRSIDVLQHERVDE